jgi:hypothetical protein
LNVEVDVDHGVDTTERHRDVAGRQDGHCTPRRRERGSSNGLRGRGTL